LGREIEGDGQTGLTLLEKIAEAAICVLGRGEARVLAHRPKAAAIHSRLDAPRVRVFARAAKVAAFIESGGVGRGVQILDFDARCRQEAFLPFGRAGQRLRPSCGAPAIPLRIGHRPIVRDALR